MFKFLTLFFSFILVSFMSMAQSPFVNSGWANSIVHQRSEVYQLMNPGNGDGNRYVVGWLKTDKHYCMLQDTISFPKLGTSGTPIVITDANGMLKTVQKWSLIDTTFLTTRNWTLSRGFLTAETDPSVYTWAKQSTKPIYNWSEIGSKPSFATVATSGDYDDLIDKPSIPAAQIASDWNQTNPLALDFIKNKPSIASGTVTSVAVSSTDLSVSGSPITSNGTIVLNLNNTAISAGTYGLLTIDAKGRATAGKRQIPYSGTTNSSGEYTVTFGTAFPAAPNIQVNMIGGNVNRVALVTSITTTGFTVKVVERQTDTLLGIVILRNSTVDVNGASVDVVVTEK